MGDHISVAIANQLVAGGLSSTPAVTWGHGLVGFTRAVADNWVATGQAKPRAQLVSEVDAFFTPALADRLAPAHLQE
jgi:hypothetical protein